ncbi:MAG: DUF5074 domain-containing protein [Muribaculaceae bacterium]|nr:DUF5074 domain-containing protein [Muribaculaceae bacterium]
MNKFFIIIFFCVAALSSSAKTVDFSKIRHYVGAGDATSAIIVKWNETQPDHLHNIDNIVWGYRFAGQTTPRQALQTLAKEDVRVFAVTANNELKALSFAVYLRRNHNARPKLNGSYLTLTDGQLETDSYSTLTSTYDSDKWQVESDNVSWHFFIERNGITGEVDMDEVMMSGDILHIEFGGDLPAGDLPYVFYAPEYSDESSLGCYIPDMEILSSDTEAALPFHIVAYKAATTTAAPGTGNNPNRIVTSNTNVLTTSNKLGTAATAGSPANAKSLWHTIVPKAEGSVNVMVSYKNGTKYYGSSTSPVAPFMGTITVKKVDCALAALSYVPSEINLPLGEDFETNLIRTAAQGYSTEQAMAEPVKYTLTGSNSVSFDENTGIITPLRPGTATLTASATALPSINAKLAITVSGPRIPLTSISFSQAETDIVCGQSSTIAPEPVPADASYLKFTWTSSNATIAKVDNNGTVTGCAPGKSTITAIYDADNTIRASFVVNVTPANPVTSITLEEPTDNDGYIHIPYMGILGLKPLILPENAEQKDFDVIISDNTIASTYTVTAYGYTLPRYPELVTHKTGTFTLQLKATDGSEVVSPVYRVMVDTPDRTPALQNEYREGFLWLNEDWYTHTNGSINFIGNDGRIKYRVYEAHNPWQALGATSQYGTVWGDKLFIMSKQANDKGDKRNNGGGCMVQADANTLKREFSLTSVNGDGRACAGANHEKIYLGAAHAITPYYFNTHVLGNAVDIEIEGMDSSDLYSKQFGDMVCTPEHLFVLLQGTGVVVIDVATDKFVTILPCTPHGIVQSMDGNIWVAQDGNRLVCYDAESLEELETVENVYITCSWDTWRSTSFSAAKKENILYWMSGKSLYSYNIDTKQKQLIYTHAGRSLPFLSSNYTDSPYGTGAYNDATGQWVYASTFSGSSLYSYTYYNFVDVKTGRLDNEIEARRYYWFPATPVFPQHENVVEHDIDEINFYKPYEPLELNLAELVSDPSGIDANIRFEIIDTPLVYDNEEPAASVRLEGKRLTVIPNKEGSSEFTLRSYSGGRVSDTVIPVTVHNLTSAEAPESKTPRIVYNSGQLVCDNCLGKEVNIYSVTGVNVLKLIPADDLYSQTVDFMPGVYVAVCGQSSSKITVK